MSFNVFILPHPKTNPVIVAINGSFTFAKFVSETISDSDMRQSGDSLALATFGSANKNRNNPICVALLKDSCMSLSMALSRLNFANVNTA
jgi:hypothetical protein